MASKLVSRYGTGSGRLSQATLHEIAVSHREASRIGLLSVESSVVQSQRFAKRLKPFRKQLISTEDRSENNNPDNYSHTPVHTFARLLICHAGPPSIWDAFIDSLQTGYLCKSGHCTIQ